MELSCLQCWRAGPSFGDVSSVVSAGLERQSQESVHGDAAGGHRAGLEDEIEEAVSGAYAFSCVAVDGPSCQNDQHNKKQHLRTHSNVGVLRLLFSRQICYTQNGPCFDFHELSNSEFANWW